MKKPPTIHKLQRADKRPDRVGPQVAVLGAARVPAETLNGLISLFNQGKAAAVAHHCERLLGQFPASAVLWNLAGAAARELGRTDQALDCFRRAAGLNPSYPDPHYNIGVTLQMTGQFGAAEAAYRAAVAIRPGYAEALNNLGYVCLVQASYAEAEIAVRRALVHRPDFPEALNNLGSALNGLGRPAEALAAYRRALALAPRFAEAQNNIGTVLLEQGKLAEAAEAFEAALAIQPDYPKALNNFGVVLNALGRFEDAVIAHRKAVALAPNLAEFHYNLGLALKELGLLDEAIAAYQRALALQPDHARACNHMGGALQEQGRIPAAVAAYRQALDHRPDFVEAFHNLCRLARLEANDPLLLRMQALYEAQVLPERRTLGDAELSSLCFALANAHDRLDDPKRAFAFLGQANALRKSHLQYDIAEDRDMFRDILLAAPIIDRAGKVVADRPPEVTPIFIVGMPRAGTTLIEQIVSAHPDVTGGGELDYVFRFGGDLAGGKSRVDQATLTEFRGRFLARIGRIAEGRRFVTDKAPRNFLFLSLIVNAIPEALIVHVARDAAAVCWSNYWTKFSSDRIGYNYDLKDVVAYYEMYRHLMGVWSGRYPGRIQDVDYETLTRHQDAETRRLIAGLGLEWNDACLSPQTNPRAVRTASSAQVRQAVYQGSSQKWRRYEPMLGGAFDGLLAARSSAGISPDGTLPMVGRMIPE